MTKKSLIIANWKMYVEAPSSALRFAKTLRKKSRAINGVDAWVAPPLHLLPSLFTALRGSNFKVGAQDVSRFANGAHTGEVGAAMLKAAGASFVLVGHSERRALGETEDVVHAQIGEALNAGLVVVLCVGEESREDGGDHFAYIAQQLRSACLGLQAHARKIIVAYEPLWAIGKVTADAISPAELQETVIFIRKSLAETLGRVAALKMPILYGGSVDASNADVLVRTNGVGGLLVGRASADVDSFIEILKACRKG